MKSRLTLRTEIQYRKGQQGFGISGWWFKTDDSVMGRVTTPPATYVDNWPVDVSETYFVNGVRMWDNTIVPVYNELEASDYPPVDYWAGNDLSIWTIDAFYKVTLAEKKAEKRDKHLDMNLGLKLASLDNERNEGQRQRAFIYDYFGWGYHYDNRITLESKSSVDYGLTAGPVIRLQGKARINEFKLEGLLSQSLLIGRVEQSGTWTDIDDIWRVTGPEGGPFTPVEQVAYYEGRFPFSKKETEALPVTEAKLKILYNITENISLGVGGFASIWWNVPVAPEFSIPGDWTAVEGTGWRLKRSDLVFYGGLVTANIKL